MPLDLFGVDTAIVADVRAAVDFCVTVENFPIPTCVGDAQPIIISDDRCEVAHDYGEVVSIFRFSNIAQYAVVAIVAVDPLETVAIEVELVERLLVAVKSVQIGHTSL